jgi:hypothetical protein
MSWQWAPKVAHLKTKNLSQEPVGFSQRPPKQRLGGHPWVSHSNPKASRRRKKVFKLHETKPAEKNQAKQHRNTQVTQTTSHEAWRIKTAESTPTSRESRNLPRQSAKSVTEVSTYSNENIPGRAQPQKQEQSQ